MKKETRVLAISNDPKYAGLVFWVKKGQEVQTRNRIPVHPYASSKKKAVFPKRISQNKLIYLTASKASKQLLGMFIKEKK